MLTVTDGAADQIKNLLGKEGPSAMGLRVAVKGGGCSGFQYHLEFVDAADEMDQVIEAKGVKVIVDPKSGLYLNGVVLKFDDGLMGSGFQIENPNARTTCGCGESFST